MMRRVLPLAAALLLAAAGAGAAVGLGLGGPAGAIKAGHGGVGVLGGDGAYSGLAEAVAAVPEAAVLPPETGAEARATVAALAAEAGVACVTVDHVLRGREEHPAYTVLNALCDCEDGRGRLVSVLLFRSGRAAALARGEVVVEEAPGGVRFYAF